MKSTDDPVTQTQLENGWGTVDDMLHSLHTHITESTDQTILIIAPRLCRSYPLLFSHLTIQHLEQNDSAEGVASETQRQHSVSKPDGSDQDGSSESERGGSSESDQDGSEHRSDAQKDDDVSVSGRRVVCVEYECSEHTAAGLFGNTINGSSEPQVLQFSTHFPFAPPSSETLTHIGRTGGIVLMIAPAAEAMEPHAAFDFIELMHTFYQRINGGAWPSTNPINGSQHTYAVRAAGLFESIESDSGGIELDVVSPVPDACHPGRVADVSDISIHRNGTTMWLSLPCGPLCD